MFINFEVTLLIFLWNIISSNVFRVQFPRNIKLRLKNGRVPLEGRVEIFGESGRWEPMCGDGWSLLEASVVCKTLNMGYANDAMQTDYFGGILTNNTYSGVKCIGNENTFADCMHDVELRGNLFPFFSLKCICIIFL